MLHQKYLLRAMCPHSQCGYVHCPLCILYQCSYSYDRELALPLQYRSTDRVISLCCIQSLTGASSISNITQCQHLTLLVSAFDFHLDIEQTQNKSKQPDASLTLNPFPSLGPMSSSYTVLQHLPFIKHSKNGEILWKANCRWGVRSGYLPASALLKGRATLHSCIPVSQDNHSILQYSLNDC